MATNLAIDDRLIRDAQLVGGHKTKKAAVQKHLKNISGIKNKRKLSSYSGQSITTGIMITRKVGNGNEDFSRCT